MRFSTILSSLTILASLVVASSIAEEPRSPVPEERGDHSKITAVHSAAEPKYEAVHVRPNPGVKDNHVEGTGVTGKPGKSKRSDYNELDSRRTPYATLVVCTGYGCSGPSYGYYLSVAPYWCYWVHWYWYNSLYVKANDGLTYGVFVGDWCWWGMFFLCHIFPTLSRFADLTPSRCPCEYVLPHWPQLLHVVG